MTVDRTTPAAPTRVEVIYDFASSPEVVFDKLVQHETYELFGLKVAQVIDGGTGPNGVGSTRVLKLGPLPEFCETTVTAERPALIEYRISKGSPLKRHWGRQELTPTSDGGTRLKYTIRFDMAVPGTAAIFAKVLTAAIKRGLPKLCQ